MSGGKRFRSSGHRHLRSSTPRHKRHGHRPSQGRRRRRTRTKAPRHRTPEEISPGGQVKQILVYENWLRAAPHAHRHALCGKRFYIQIKELLIFRGFERGWNLGRIRVMVDKRKSTNLASFAIDCSGLQLSMNTCRAFVRMQTTYITHHKMIAVDFPDAILRFNIF